MGRVVANACYLIVEKGVLLLSSLVLLVLVGRRTGVEGLGQYTFVVSLASLMMPLLDLGLNSRIVKGISGADPHAAAWRADAVKIKLMVAPAAIAAPALFGWGTGRSASLVTALILYGMSSVGMSIGDVANAVFKGRERMGYSAGITLLWNGLLLLGCWWALIAGWGLIGLASAYLLARGSYALLASALSRRVWSARRSAAPAEPRWSLIRKGILSLPAAYFLLNLLNLSLVLVSLFQGDREGGHYALGQRLVAALFIMSTAGIEAAFPALSRRFAQSPADLSRPLVRAAAVLTLLSAGTSAIILIVAEPAVILLFGPLPDALPVIRLMVWAVPPFALCALFHYALLASDRERTAFLSMNALIVTGAVLNAGAIWRWGTIGGGAALVGWGIFSAIFMGLVVWRGRARHAVSLP